MIKARIKLKQFQNWFQKYKTCCRKLENDKLTSFCTP